jgi:hypothetical protein
MKNLIKLSALLAALALVLAGCDSALTQTTPDFDTVHASYGVNGLNKVASPHPTFAGTLDADTGTNPVKNQLTVTFPDIDLDALRDSKSLAELEAQIKTFLHFYTIKKESVGSNITNQVVDWSLRTEISDWKVIRRNGRIVFIEFPGLSNSYSEKIEIKIDSAKYTYKHGQKVDKDDNGVAGEAFYDDYYGYVSVDTDGSASATMSSGSTSDQVNVNNSAVTVAVSLTETGSPHGEALGFATATATTELAEISFTIGDPNTATSYADTIKALFAIEELGEDGVWKPSSLTLSFTKVSTGSQDYYARVTLTHKTVYRVKLTGLKGAALLNEAYGGKRRLDFNLFGTGQVGLKDTTHYSSPKEVVNSSLSKEYTANFFDSVTVASDSEERNVTVTLALNNAVKTTVIPPAVVPSGLKPLTAALLNKDFKLGIVAGSGTPTGGQGLPAVAGGSSYTLSFVPDNPGTWAHNVTFVNIADAKLVYANNVAAVGTVPDTLVLYLDPGFRLGGKNKAYLFVSGEYGFADQVFGNWSNYTGGYKGLRAYGALGSGTPF